MPAGESTIRQGMLQKGNVVLTFMSDSIISGQLSRLNLVCRLWCLHLWLTKSVCHCMLKIKCKTSTYC